MENNIQNAVFITGPPRTNPGGNLSPAATVKINPLTIGLRNITAYLAPDMSPLIPLILSAKWDLPTDENFIPFIIEYQLN